MLLKGFFAIISFMVADIMQFYLLQIEPTSISKDNILIAGISAVTAGLVFLFLLYVKQNKEFQRALESNSEKTEKIYQTVVKEGHEAMSKIGEIIKDHTTTLKELPSELKRQLKD